MNRTDAAADLTVRTEWGLPFRETGEGTLTADVYRPDDDRARPAFVYVHGGAWRDRNPREYRDGLRALAARGFACVALTYRLSGEATYPAAVRDVACGVGWARTRAGVAADRVAVGGLSAGAHLATLVANAGEHYLPGDAPADPRVRAAVGFSGNYDLTRPVPGSGDDPERAFLGATRDEAPERYRTASPATHADDAPPTLLAHGTDDDVLPYDGATAYRDALREAGRHVQFASVHGGGHLFPFAETWFGPVLDRLASFLAATTRAR